MDRSRRQVVALVGSLMLAIALTALDVTVVGTAMPTIVGSLGGLSLYSWLVAAYLLTSTTTVPIYGRLADMYGRKPIILVGIALFVGGSMLCGLSGDMMQLIVFRAIQGLGAGAVMPVAMTIIGDVFSVEQRARMQGLFSSVWGVSSVIGPALGAGVTSLLSWHWIFFINLPVGIVSVALLLASYREKVEKHERRVDLVGAGLLTAAITALLVALQNTGNSGGPDGQWTAGLYLVSVALMAIFLRREIQSTDPTIPMTLFLTPVIGLGYLVGFLSGFAQFGVSTYVPLFVQGAMGGDAITVGMVLGPMSIGWPVGSIASGRLILKLGYRPVLIAGMAAITVGAIGLPLLVASSPLPVAMITVLLFGLGMGLSSTPIIIAVQNAVDWRQRGVATALVQFTRSIGGAIGVAAMGSLFNASLAAELANRLSAGAAGTSPGDLINTILDPARRAQLPPPIMDALRNAIALPLREVFAVSAGVAAIGLIIAFLAFPGGSVSDHAAPTKSPTTAGTPPARS